MDLLELIEQSSFPTWVRESGSLLGFPTFLFAHTLGLGTISGLSAVISLRLLGFAPGISLKSLEPAFRLIWIAFWVTAVSGTALLATDLQTKLQTPVFYAKLLCIALAMVVVQRMRRVASAPQADGSPLPADAGRLAIAALALWMGATTAGRLIAYLGPMLGA